MPIRVMVRVDDWKQPRILALGPHRASLEIARVNHCSVCNSRVRHLAEMFKQRGVEPELSVIPKGKYGNEEEGTFLTVEMPSREGMSLLDAIEAIGEATGLNLRLASNVILDGSGVPLMPPDIF